LTPPTVTITGIKEGDTISGPVTVRIDARGPNDILYIYAAFGKTPGASLLTAPRVIYSNTYTTGQFSINPADYGVAGATTFEVVVYDWNYNRTPCHLPGLRDPRRGWIRVRTSASHR
jgi:hypothetical protein